MGERQRRKTRPVQDRFFEKVSGGDVGTCWEWTGALTGHGYGNFWTGEGYRGAHRWAYIFFRGDPGDLHLDHLCRNPACVNPWHLEPVTVRVNSARGMGAAVGKLRNVNKTHCSRGHEYNDANVYTNPNNGWRYCKICIRVSQYRWQERHKG